MPKINTGHIVNFAFFDDVVVLVVLVGVVVLVGGVEVERFSASL